MSKTISAVFVQLAVVLLPMMGVEIGTEELTSFFQTAAIIVTSAYIWFQRYQRGDITLSGAKR